MLDFISKDVREYMERNSLEFTDFERAALIHNSGLPVLKRLELLEQLAEEAENVSLKEQILARLASDRQDLEAFRGNTKGYVYAVEARDDKEPYICGYFATADLAYAHGMRQGCKFEIQKFLIVGFDGREAKKSKGYPKAAAQYGKDGTLEHFWSSEIEKSNKENIPILYDLSRFETAFIYIPNPFERGDIVRSTMGRERHGVVVTSQQEWEEFLDRVESGKAKWADFSDASITVDFLRDDGGIMHSHVNPAFLEKYEPQKNDMDYDVLTAASAVHQGGPLDFFVLFLENYRKRLKKKGLPEN